MYTTAVARDVKLAYATELVLSSTETDLTSFTVYPGHGVTTVTS